MSEIIKHPGPRATFTLAPSNFSEAERFAELVSRSDLAPKDYRGKPGNILVAVQMGAELGMAPMQALQNIAVINGKPCVYGDAMLAVCQAHPAFEAIHEAITEAGATVTVKRAGMEPTVRNFSVDDAKRAGLWGKAGPWQSYPKRMLQLRARAFALRDAFADALRGLNSAEEVTDYAPAPTPGRYDREAGEGARPALPAPAADAVTLDEVLAAIATAGDEDALAAAGDLAKKLDPLVVEVARKEWATRRDELREAAFGAAVGSAPAGDPTLAEQFLIRINEAETADGLSAIADRMKAAAGLSDNDRLRLTRALAIKRQALAA